MNQNKHNTDEHTPKIVALPKIIERIQHPACFIVCAVFAALSYLFLDKNIALYFQHSQALYPFAARISLLGNGASLLSGLAVLFLVSRYVMKSRLWQNHVLRILSAFLLSGILCDVLKFICGRARPTHFLSEQPAIYGFKFFQVYSSYWSFPSGHTVAITAITLSLCYIFPRYSRALITLAIVVGLSRVVALRHYLSDVVIGWYFGAIITVYWHQFLAKRRWRILEFSPK